MPFSLKDRPITQNVVGSAVYALLILAGGVVLAYLQAHYPDWFAVALWGLIGCALMAIPVISVALITRLPKRPQETSEENVEAKIRRWLDAFSVGIKKADAPETYFALVATFNNGLSLNVQRPKKFGRYVFLLSAIDISPEHRAVIDGLPAGEKEIFAVRLSVELCKTQIGGYYMDLSVGRILLERRIPITSALTEGSFMDAADQLMNAHLGVIQTFVLMIMGEQKKLNGARPKRKSH